MQNNARITLLSNLTLFLIGATLVILPIIFAPSMTDALQLPKKVLLLGIAILGILLWSGTQAFQKFILFRKSSSDMTSFLYIIVLAISAGLSVYVSDSILWAMPIIGTIIIGFLMSQVVKNTSDISFLMLCLITGFGITAIYSIFSFFSLYLFPIPLTHAGAFSPVGSLLDQAVILGIGIAMLGILFIRDLKKRISLSIFLTALPLLLMLFGEGTTLVRLFTTQKIVLLPFVTGFQIGFAAISQDSARLLQSFLFGSGPGTFLIDFSRFKPVSFNQFNDLWYLSFTTSTSLVLELLATTGLIGIVSFCFLIVSAVKAYKKNLLSPFGIGLIVTTISLITLPVSFAPFAYFFLLLSLTSIANRLHTKTNHEVEISLVTRFNQQFSFSMILPSALFFLGVIVTLVVAYFASNYVRSDIAFQESLNAASTNNGSLAYKKQVEAVTDYPYKDVYQRVFSQTSLSLANSLLSLSNTKNASPSQQTKDQALQLIQQSISTGRVAVSLSPLSSNNWQNLGTIYRSLIGLGQGADGFAITSWQQAQTLDPANPQEFVALGGIYYQLGQWDNAIRQFQIAINLKPDYPNAYYNLGHAYEAKGDLENALKAYQMVSQLVKDDQNNSRQIQTEIDRLQGKINTTPTPSPTQKTGQSPKVQESLVAPVQKPTPVITGTPIPLPTAGQ